MDDIIGSPLFPDFIRYYQINVEEFFNDDKLPREDSLLKLLSLIYHLPEDSQTKIEIIGKPFNFSDLLLSRMEYFSHINIYSQQKKGSRGEKPKLLLPPHIEEYQKLRKNAQQPKRFNPSDFEPHELHNFLEQQKAEMAKYTKLSE